ncbi:hypothetical protein Clacol_000764 [Clathrus columnatus]|uniref:F-box domain-containing protein n=1 Tax=Clathrus columnatus TaxID=1419009 RepID=A0AAV4ZX35_9AGAM|nr:hypothetical protein Clacol_000764 [Clathrus columnatus]
MDFTALGYDIPKFPVEIWETILLHLSRAGDLYNVSLACRYLNFVTRNLLYKHLYLDPNHYAVYTLAFLDNHPLLRQQVSELSLLPPIMRNISQDVQDNAEAIYPQLDLPLAPPPPVTLRALLWSPLGMISNPQRSGVHAETCIRPIFDYLPRFTNLSFLSIIGDCVPANFLRWVLPLQSLTSLELRETQIASGLNRAIPCGPLPLRRLTIIKCWTKAYTVDNPVPTHLCDALLSNSPHLESLSLDYFVERAAYNLISDLPNPPALKSLSCTGFGLQDHDSIMLSRVFSSLGSLTTLNISRIPRELGPILPVQALPNLTTITGQIRSIGVFLHGRPPRPLKNITFVDFPTSTAGGLSWECILIAFLEGLRQMNVDLQRLTFNLASWSEELFLCICQLFPKIRELKMQFILGPGVDEYFRISFGPRFLPRLNCLEVLHIFEKNMKFKTQTRLPLCPKGVLIPTFEPLNLTEADNEEISEAPIHLRRWEKMCPSLREVAFSREIWWRRKPSEPGGWSLIDDTLPELTSEHGGV